MVFDPEKVQRWEPSDAHGDFVSSVGEYVKRSDYDQLLALYREAVGKLQVIAETHDGYPNSSGQLQGVARRCLNSIGVRYEIVLASLMPPDPFHTRTSFARKNRHEAETAPSAYNFRRMQRISGPGEYPQSRAKVEIRGKWYLDFGPTVMMLRLEGEESTYQCFECKNKFIAHDRDGLLHGCMGVEE